MVTEVWCQVSEFEMNEATAKNYLEVEDLEVYKKLCRLHNDEGMHSHAEWP